MKYLLIIASFCFLCFSASAGNTSIHKTDALIKVSEIVPNFNNFSADTELSTFNSTKDLDCWIVWVVCYTCNASVQTQYCDEGLHGTLEEWGDSICAQLCGPDL